ncbi:MAG: hypothetical protein IJH64_00845 [Oscillospiraceae bacterium]|nr:hypothetical protein [Oscillospiraceae bacterium]
MDKVYMMSYDAGKAKIKITEYPVVKESELTVTILNGVKMETRIRKADLGVLNCTTYVMSTETPDKEMFMRKIITRMNHSIEILTGMLQNELLKKAKAEELLAKIRRQ